MLKKLLLSPDADAGGNPPPPEPTPPASPARPEPPPAASVVLSAARSEKEVNLEAELEAERTARKDREQRINQLEDENRQLKTVTKPAKEERGWKFPFEE